MGIQYNEDFANIDRNLSTENEEVDLAIEDVYSHNNIDKKIN